METLPHALELGSFLLAVVGTGIAVYELANHLMPTILHVLSARLKLPVNRAGFSIPVKRNPGIDGNSHKDHRSAGR